MSGTLREALDELDRSLFDFKRACLRSVPFVGKRLQRWYLNRDFVRRHRMPSTPERRELHTLLDAMSEDPWRREISSEEQAGYLWNGHRGWYEESDDTFRARIKRELDSQ